MSIYVIDNNFKLLTFTINVNQRNTMSTNKQQQTAIKNNQYLHEIVNSLLEILQEFICVLTETSIITKLKATIKHKESFVTITMFVRRERSAQQTCLHLSDKTDQLVYCCSAVRSSRTVTCRSHCEYCEFSQWTKLLVLWLFRWFKLCN